MEPRRKARHDRRGGSHLSVGAGTWARSKDAVVGRLRHRPHLNGANPRVVRSRHGRGSGGLVALVIFLASVMRVRAPLLPAARTWRGRTTGRR
jgi:hypothetical protein